MKLKTQLILLAAICCMVSCDKDETPEATNHAQAIAGKYEGYSVSEFKYTDTPMTTAGEAFSVAAKEDGTGMIVFESATWGKFNIPAASVSLRGDVYEIAGDGKTVMGMDPASQKEYECAVKGTISKDKKIVSLEFSVPSVMGGLTVKFLPGEAPLNMLVAGVYNGKLNVSVGSSDMGEIDKSKVTIKSSEKEKVEVTLAGFGFGDGAMKMEDIVVKEVSVTKNADGAYVLSGDVDAMSGTTNVTGKLEGAISKEGEATITFTLKPGAMPMNIVAVFTGK